MPLLSALDQSPVPSSGTPSSAIRETLKLAEAANRLAPEGLIGAGGVMLLAEVFGLERQECPA